MMSYKCELSVLKGLAVQLRIRELVRRCSDMRVIELGAGPSIPSVRNTCEQAWKYSGGTFLRINPRDPQVEPNALSLAMGAQDALLAIDRTIDAGRVRSPD